LLGEIRRRPASDRQASKGGIGEGFPHSFRLPFQGGEVLRLQSGDGVCNGEEVAEAASHLAERNVEVEKEGVLFLLSPEVRERYGRIESAISRLVRIGVAVRDVRRAVDQRLS